MRSKTIAIVTAIVVIMSMLPSVYGESGNIRINKTPGTVSGAVMDGNHIFYTVWDNENRQGVFVVYDLLTQTYKEFSSPGMSIGFTGYYQGMASNGYCAFHMSDTNNKMSLYGYDPEKSAIRKLNNDNANVQNWSVWDKYVFMPTYSGDKKGIYFADITKDEPAKLIYPFDGTFNFCMSKAGEGYFVYEAREYKGAGPSASDTNGDVQLYEIATGKTTIVDNSPGEQGCPAIQNGVVYYLDFVDGGNIWNYRGSKLMSFTISTGEKKVVSQFPKNIFPFVYMNPKSDFLGLIIGDHDTSAQKIAVLNQKTDTISDVTVFSQNRDNIIQYGSVFGDKIIWLESSASPTMRVELKTVSISKDGLLFGLVTTVLSDTENMVKCFSQNDNYMMYAIDANLYVKKIEK